MSTTILNFFEFFATAPQQPLRPLRNPRKIPARFPLPGQQALLRPNYPPKSVAGTASAASRARSIYGPLEEAVQELALSLT